MSTPAPPEPRPPTVFLSYASEDRSAAQALRDALPALGLEVWYDESDLTGGDAWDQKIRRQIRECDFFMPLISARTEARPEGYFRREWRFAVERTLDMADDHLFLLPVVIDETKETGARVPDRFLTVQWTWVPGGQRNGALEALCRRLVHGPAAAAQPARQAGAAPGQPPPKTRKSAPPRAYPEFPHKEGEHQIPYGLRVVGWGFQSAWAFFTRLPRWVQFCLYGWLIIVLLSRGCTTPGGEERRERHADAGPPAAAPLAPAVPGPSVPAVPAAGGDRASDEGMSAAADATRLGMQIAQQFTGVARSAVAPHKPLLVVQFGAPAGDTAARKFAAEAFSQIFGKMVLAHGGKTGMAPQPLPSLDPATVAARGRALHAAYVICGAVEGAAANRSLDVKIVSVEDGTVLWSKMFPLAGADPATIAAEVAEKVPSPDES